MQHAVDTNKKDSAQKAARRATFNGNHSDKTRLKHSDHALLDFSHLTQEAIAEERARIHAVFAKRRKKSIFVFILSICIIAFGAIWGYFLVTK